MMKIEEIFFEAIENTAFNKQHHTALYNKLEANNESVKYSKAFYSDLELARTRAAFIKNKTLDNLDKTLIEFEANFIRKGGKVIWAQDNEEAIEEIIKIIQKKSVTNIVKDKSILFEEIDLTKELKEKKISATETDFGNYIQTIAGENGYHPVFSTLHQSKEKISELLSKTHTIENFTSSQELADVISKEIKSQLRSSEISISGTNFLVADTGSVVNFESEANNALLAAFPKTQIVLVGIEEIIPSINDVDLFLHLFATHGIGNSCNTYANIISGPKQSEENDGPEEMFVILIDNGRSNVLAQTNQRSALGCIKCGACFNVCPVYTNIGGHAYQAAHNGPIGSVITPHMKGMDDYKYLSFASTLCGKCVSVCPVKIDIPKLLQHNRTDSVKISPPGKTEKLSIFFWKTAMLKRSNMDKGGAKLKNFMLRQFFKKSWGERREMPLVAQKSFNQIWRERKGIK